MQLNNRILPCDPAMTYGHDGIIWGVNKGAGGCLKVSCSYQFSLSKEELSAVKIPEDFFKFWNIFFHRIFQI